MKEKTFCLRFVYNLFYYWIGLIILALNKVRHDFEGYVSPRPFSINDFERGIDHDFGIVKNWDEALGKYVSNFTWRNKNILELGPGADLGIGLNLLSLGAKKYSALDINNLAKSVPMAFYEKLFDRLKKDGKNVAEINKLREELHKTTSGRRDALNYVHDPKFSVKTLEGESVDIVVSNAAFEHFDDVEKTIADLKYVTKPGSIFVAFVDLQTHTRWIREKDPLNIYRYSDRVYNFFKFLGSPNRVRPEEYVRFLEKNGWENIQIIPNVELGKKLTDSVRNSLQKKFRRDTNISWLNVVILAEKE